MSDGNYEPFGSKTMRDWVLGIGEFSEENLAKSRQEAADRIVEKVMAAMQKRVAEAFLQVTNHDAAPTAGVSDRQCAGHADIGGTIPDAEPAAIAEPSEWGTRREGQGTGNTQEPVAWAVVYPNGAEAIIAWRKADAEDLATASDEIVPLYRQPQPSLTQEEREAVKWAIVAADLEKTETAGEFSAFVAERAATLRGLLERMK